MILALCLAAPLALQSTTPPLYGVEIDGDRLIQVDPDTGASVASIPLPFPNVGGLAADPFSRRFFGIDAETSELFAIDPGTGATVLIAATQLSVPQGLAICPLSGRAFATGIFDLRLQEIDLETGVPTPIDLPISRVTALEFDPTSGDLYALTLTGQSNTTLVRIDVDGLTKVDVGQVNAFFMTGLAFTPDGELLGVRNTGPTADSNTLYRIDKATGNVTLIAATPSFGNLLSLAFDDGNGVGSSYCTPEPNSTGVPSSIVGFGSSFVGDGDLSIEVAQLPQNAVALLLASPMEGFVPMPPASSGNLCLGGEIGRFLGPGQVQSSGIEGRFTLAVDLAAIPQPTGTVTAAPGETWHFQAWHRDTAPSGLTSNFSDGLRVLAR